MPALLNHKNLQAVLGLPFCYQCGKAFTPGEEINMDHVPPKSCFALSDRSPPLKLPTHTSCNASYKVSDERVGQFISLKHRRVPSRRNRRLQITQFAQDGKYFAALTNVDMHGEIERWVRAFHAALYHEPCTPETRFGIQTPFPTARPSPDGRIVNDGFKRQHFLFVKTIKDNRAANNLDTVVCNNGRLRYECVWNQATNGNWICIFALDLYGWKDLGDVNNFPARGCTGFYQMPSAQMPAIGTKVKGLRVQIPNYEPADPFGR